MSAVSKITVLPATAARAKSRAGKVRKVQVASWRVYFHDGTSKDRTKQFEDDPHGRIAFGEFITLLHRAARFEPGVVLDARLHPQVSVAVEDPTVVELLRRYWKAFWPRAAGNGRKTGLVAVRALGAMLVDDPANTPPAFDAYIATVFLRGPDEPGDDDLVPIIYQKRTFSASDVATARRWLAQHSLRASQVRVHDVQAVLDRLTVGCTPSTESRRWTTIRAFLNHAGNAKAFAPELVAGVTVDTSGDGQRPVDPDEIPTIEDMWAMTEAIAHYAGGRWRALPPLLGGAGLRIGEALALRRKDCSDHASGGMWIKVRGAVSEPGRAFTDAGDAIELRDPKGKGRAKASGRERSYRWRSTYLPPREAAELRTHLACFVGQDPDDLVFPSSTGTHMSLAHLSDRVWSKAVADAFPVGHRLHGLSRHSFRHLAATRWLHSGVRIPTAVKWGGWSNAATFLGIYVHCLPNDDDHGIDRMTGFPNA